jgi:hypothetical protein
MHDVPPRRDLHHAAGMLVRAPAKINRILPSRRRAGGAA